MSIFKVFKLIFVYPAKAAMPAAGAGLRKLLRNFLERAKPPKSTDFLKQYFGREYVPGDFLIFLMALKKNNHKMTACRWQLPGQTVKNNDGAKTTKILSP